MCLMYETTLIPESKLPPVYVRKERKRHKTDPSGTCAVGEPSEGEPGLLRCFLYSSRPLPAVLSCRKEEEATPRGGRRATSVPV